ILLGEEGSPVLADCGVARLLEDSTHVTGTGAVVGTPAYMSPEQAAGHEVGPASDQYSLAVVLFETLVGRPPFEGRTPVATALAHLQQAPPSPRALNPDLSPGVEAVLLQALSKQPEDRFPGCTAFIDAVTLAAHGPTGAAFDTATAIRDITPTPPLQTRRLAPNTPGTPIPAPMPTPVPAAPARQTAWAPPTPISKPALATAPAPVVTGRAAPGAAYGEPGPARGVQRYATIVVICALLLAAGAFAASQMVPGLGPAGTPTPPAAARTVANPSNSGPTAVLAVGAATATATSAPASTTVPTTTSEPTSTPRLTSTATPAPPTNTPVPPQIAAWRDVTSKLDAGLWNNDLAGAARLIAEYLATYRDSAVPEARDKLYSADIELAKQRLAANDPAGAQRYFKEALDLRPDDPLANGELKKTQLYLAGVAALSEQNWQTAADVLSELVSIQSDFLDSQARLDASQAELRKTWTPTPVPRTQPEPKPQPQPHPHPQPTKPPFVPPAQ
ncbi:MAG: protein kinase, partial [Chloroflexi bacterium]|nr:protein kinase [Chloroflexota bacterium]